MFGALAQKFFGTTNDRIVKAYRKRIGAINALEPELEALTDSALDEMEEQSDSDTSRPGRPMAILDDADAFPRPAPMPDSAGGAAEAGDAEAEDAKAALHEFARSGGIPMRWLKSVTE